ncbi:AAA-ATPase Vps4-associated 1 family protein [Sporobolomyces salmoneus]|uniref:AAA-ATPase Vps4-associated 1 family protein n=1 Tax=Sporobolomyces salmoneus TaxID=183962 RepID=UPI00317E5D7E
MVPSPPSSALTSPPLSRSPSALTSPRPPSRPGPPKLLNLYNLRQTATPKPCFVCSKDSTVCLAATNGDGEMVDWFWVCHSHCLDPAFAKPASMSSTTTSSPTSSPSPTTTVSQAEIDKVKAEYAEKQKRKSESTDAKDKPTEPTSTSSKAFSVLRTSVSSISSLASSAASSSSSVLFPPPQPVIPSASELLKQEAKTSKVFVLSRSYFEMRVTRKRKEWEVKDAKERSGGWSFPKVPKGGLP